METLIKFVKEFYKIILTILVNCRLLTEEQAKEIMKEDDAADDTAADA
ncbi:MAG: hypothetical protein IJ766_04765 [Clostridia bacterium]|nr:hypothetical protein [Clostridia bacterium]